MGFPPMSFMRRARSCVSGNLFLSQGSFSFATLLVANFPARDSTLLFAGNACLVLRALVLACIASSHLWRGIRPCVWALARGHRVRTNAESSRALRQRQVL